MKNCKSKTLDRIEVLKRLIKENPTIKINVIAGAWIPLCEEIEREQFYDDALKELNDEMETKPKRKYTRKPSR
jgi:hypothetical protein